MPPRSHDALPGPTEAEFTEQVLQLAKLHGWRSLHCRPARTAHGWVTAVAGDGKGFPDVLLLREDKLCVFELKVGRRVIDADQEAWLKAFARLGVPAMVAYPEDWKLIEKLLSAPASEKWATVMDKIGWVFPDKIEGMN